MTRLRPRALALLLGPFASWAPAPGGAAALPVLDIDANTAVDAHSDGLLVARRLFGLSAAPLTQGALAPDATRTDPAAVADHIDAHRADLDIDDNGSTDSLTDGLLILRRLLGFSDVALTRGALAADAMRTDPAAIAARIDALAATPVPVNQFNLGDSIGEGEAADGTIGEAHHETVWSTGFAAGDEVYSLNERFETTDASTYYENNVARDPRFNRAVSGNDMGDLAEQAREVVDAAAETPTGTAGMVTVLLGSNDVCAQTLEAMTDPVSFETDFRAGLDVLASDPRTSAAWVLVSSIPAIYWLWEAKRDEPWCRLVAWRFVPCENLLDNPADDCESGASRRDPDHIHPGDGADCTRRKQFHARIRDEYNPILANVVEEYRNSGNLPNARFVDIFDVRFDDAHVNDGDCFHPSAEGHALLAESHWCRSVWGRSDPLCTP